MSFWRFGFQKASPIDAMLEKEDVTLEDLFEEDDLLQEVKTHNKNLVTFLTREENMGKILRYIVEAPSEDQLNASAQLTEEDVGTSEGPGTDGAEEGASSSSGEAESAADEDESGEKEAKVEDGSGPSEGGEEGGEEKQEGGEDGGEEGGVDGGEAEEAGAAPMSEYDRIQMLMRYSFLSVEIVKCEVWSILDTIIRSNEHLDLLLSFLDYEPPLSELQANYCCSVLSLLLNKKPYLLVAKCQSTENLVHNLVKHFGTYAVMELTTKLVSCEDYSSEWMFDDDLCGELVAALNTENPSVDLVENVAQALNDIVLFGTQVASSSQATILQQFQDVPFVDSLVEALLHDYCVAPGFKVLDTLVRNTVNDFPEAQDELDDCPAVIQAIVKRFERLHALLMTPSPMATLKTTFGVLSPPLGSQRLEVIQFFLNMFRTHFHVVDEQLVQYKVMQSLLDLFFQYEWNNALHLKVCGMVEEVLEAEHTPELRSTLMVECRLLDRLLEGVEKNAKATERGPGYSLGYMGFVHSMSMTVMHARSHHPEVSAVVDSHDGWLEYAETTLKEKEEEEGKQLGGFKPMGEHEDEEEEDDLHHMGIAGNPMAFQQQFANFTDSFDDDNEDSGRLIIIDDNDDFADEEEEEEDEETGVVVPSGQQAQDEDDEADFEALVASRASAYAAADAEEDGEGADAANSSFDDMQNSAGEMNFANFDSMDAFDADEMVTMSPEQAQGEGDGFENTFEADFGEFVSAEDLPPTESMEAIDGSVDVREDEEEG